MSMSADDPDRATVDTLAGVAVQLMTGYLGNPELADPFPSPITNALVLVTVELYRRKDAAFGVLNTYASGDFGPVRISTDWLKGVESMVHPYMRDSFGIG
jgi:predicted aminopeptidase